MYKVIECVFGFETGDNATMKTLKVFVVVAQALFWILFLAFCMAPVWFWLNK